MLPHPIDFVPNESDDLHCFQASVRMAWQGLSGESLGLDEVERLTGFKAGEQTWPFAGMLGFARSGYAVDSIEDFDPHRFIEEPTVEIRRQTGDDEITQHILEVSDVDAQRRLVSDCLAEDLIDFTQRVPTLEDLIERTSRPQTAVICNVNYHALGGESGYNGHFVLLGRVDTSSVQLQNPGLPPIPDQETSTERFLSAWSGPSGGMANALVVSAP